MWHKAVLLISAAPITVVMNSVRIAIAGILVQKRGVDWLEGFSHFFEGWVIFVACILILFALARIMLFFNKEKMGLAEALDLDTDGLAIQASRIRFVQPSRAIIAAAAITATAVLTWQSVPERELIVEARSNFAEFPRRIGDWEQQGPPRTLSESVEVTLGADDYHAINLFKNGETASVEFFSAWYSNQSSGGVHSPEICLPGGGWEIAWLERSDLTTELGSNRPFMINRAIIQKGETRMMVYFWYEQKGRTIAWDMAAKFWLMIDGIRTGRTDGGLVRLTTRIDAGESDIAAEARLKEVLLGVIDRLPRFIPGA